MLKIVNGDLLKAKEKFIVHQCNAQGVMGSGVARQIATLYPEAEKQYKEFINKNREFGREFVMGQSIFVPVYNQRTNREQCIVNIIGQDRFGRDGQRYTEYRYLFKGILKVLDEAESTLDDIALPYKIGCFRGGGDWDNIVYPFLQIISEDFPGNIVIYRLDRN